MSDVARLLEVLRDTAARGDDMVSALWTCGLPGAERAGQRLADGATLPEAIAGLVPPRLSALLIGGIPPLATVAALLADEAWREAERRRMVADHLAYPLASCLVIGVLALTIRYVTPAAPWYGSLTSLGWAVPPALLAVMIAVAPWMPHTWRIPGSAWTRHLDFASRWSRAALAIRWRLTEAQASRLLGVDLMPWSGILGSPGAEHHCRMLADWHRRAAQRRLAMTAYLAAALVLAAGGGLVLGSFRMWTGTPM